MTLQLNGTASDFGIVGDGKTDDTAGWQKLLNAPDGTCVQVPPGLCSVITAPLTMFSKSGVHIVNTGGCDARPQGQRGAELLWKGPAGVDAMLLINSCRLCEFEGLSFSCDVANAPACAVRVDTIPTTPAATYNSTRHTFRRCVFTAPPVKSPAVGSFVCLDIMRQAQTNNEFMHLEDCLFGSVASSVNWGVGVRFGGSSNGKTHLVRRCAITGATAAYWMGNGSARFEQCTGSGNGIDFQINAQSDPIAIEDCNFENSGMAVMAHGVPNGAGLANAALAIRGCRWSIAGPTVFDLKCRVASITDSKFISVAPAGAPLPIPFAPNQGDFRTQLDRNTWGKFAPLAWPGADPCLTIGPLENQPGF